MLRWALAFLVIALIAALLGFTNIMGASMAIASTLFWVFVALFILALLVSLVTGKRTPVP